MFSFGIFQVKPKMNPTNARNCLFLFKTNQKRENQFKKIILRYSEAPQKISVFPVTCPPKFRVGR